MLLQLVTYNQKGAKQNTLLILPSWETQCLGEKIIAARERRISLQNQTSILELMTYEEQ
jgi:hypothetical protein